MYYLMKMDATKDIQLKSYLNKNVDSTEALRKSCLSKATVKISRHAKRKVKIPSIITVHSYKS